MTEKSGPGVTPYGGHAGAVLSVACSPDGTTFASGGKDGTVQVWDAHTRRQLLRIPGHVGPVQSVGHAPDGSALASVGDDGAVRIWDPRTGEMQRQLTTHNGRVYSVAYSPDGTVLATAGDDGLRISAASTGEPRLPGDRRGAVWSVAYSPDGASYAYGANDGTVRICDCGTGTVLRRLKGHIDPVRSIAFAPGGSALATADSGGSVRIWDLGIGAASLPGQARSLPGHAGPVHAIAYSPDGTMLASGDQAGDVWIWDVSTSGNRYRLTDHTGCVWSVAFLADGILASAGDDGFIRIWDTGSGEQTADLTGHTGGVRSAAYAPDDDALATGGDEDGTVRIWDARTGQQRHQLGGHSGGVRSVTYAPDGGTLASADKDGTVRIWDARTGLQIRMISRDRGGQSVAYDRGGALLACGGEEGVSVWNVHTGTHEFLSAGPVHVIAYSPAGPALVGAGDDGTIRIWAPGTGTEPRLLRGHATGVRSLAYSPDGITLASGGNDGAVWVWDTATGDLRHQLTGHDGPVHAVAYSPDGTTLASAGADGITRIQDARTGHEYFRLTGHTGPVDAIAYSRYGTTLATVGDMTIRIWNARNGAQFDGTGFGAPLAAGRSLAGVVHDSPSAKDRLAAKSDAEKLAELIGAATTSPPLAIALIGDWGAGKSSVMLQIQEHVKEHAEMARQNPGLSLFAGNVRQVSFNAWHYCDDRLWSGLAEHLFRTLAADDPGADDTTGADAGAARRAELGARLARLGEERKHIDEALSAVADARQPTGWLSRIDSPGYISRVATATSRELVREVRADPWPLLTWAALVGAAYGAWSLWGSAIGAAAAATAVVVAPAAAVIQRLRKWRDKETGIAAGLNKRLEDRRRAVQQEMASVREHLALVDATARLSAFLDDRASPHAYREFRGLIGQVRSDLERLAESLDRARGEWKISRSSAAAPLERIVLYIDDLDRCPPPRVVEVLEAIHLMLTLDLFVVVVAVDARWLITSLECHYQEMFGAVKDPTAMPAAEVPYPAPDAGPASPVDYLDKIFQIPYVLAPPPPEAMESYMAWLLSPEATPTAGVAPGGQDGAAGGPWSSAPGSAADHTMAEDGQPRGDSVGEAAEAGPGHGESGRTSSGGFGRGGREERPSGWAAGEQSTGVRGLRPRQLQLNQPEIEFMKRLGPVMPTPRAAKKLANLYRLVRIGIKDEDLAGFLGSESGEAGGPYQVVQILLAVLVASPVSAQGIFRDIGTAPDDSNILTVLAGASEFTGGGFCDRIRAELARIAETTPMLTNIEEFRKWCPALARYSFHTRTLAGEPPPPGHGGPRGPRERLQAPNP